MLGLEDTTRMY